MITNINIKQKPKLYNKNVMIERLITKLLVFSQKLDS